MIRKIPQLPSESETWGNHKSDTMAKVQHISGISKRIPFEGFDFYDLFRVTFENSELGRMKRLLPLHEMAVNFGLVSNHDVNPREYLNDIISRMPYMGRASHEQLVELLPHKWKLIPHEPAVTLPTDGKPFVTKVYR